MRAPFLLLRRLGTDRRGLSVVELGLCMPILSVVLLGLIDMSSLFSSQMSLQQAAARSLERVHVSMVTDEDDVEANVKEEAAAAAGVDADQVEVTTWLECDNEPAEGVTACDGDQVASRYVQVTIESSYTPYFPYSPLPARAANGSVPISATASVRYS